MNANMPIDVVTGAFSYSGRSIARELTALGRQVRTLTGHLDRATSHTNIDARPLDFGNPDGLVESMRGATTLYNTYWVRFAHGGTNHVTAVRNSRILFEAARRAGIDRIVHVSITNPSSDSPYPYFAGKAEVEAILANLGLPYAIARPAILFGGNDVLVNNIAWLLRHVPVFAVGGRGDYRVRPIHVDDLARLCVRLGQDDDIMTVDAVGPESLTFVEMVQTIRTAVGSHAVVVHVPGSLLPGLSGVVGALLRDRLLTAEEFKAMSDGLADSAAPATGEVALSDWVIEHGSQLGRTYANELGRHFRPAADGRRP